MKFGTWRTTGSTEIAHIFEESGYDGLFLGEHHSPYLREAMGLKPAPRPPRSEGDGGPVQGMWPVLAWMAAQTKTLELGSCCQLLGMMASPIHVAEDAAAVDQLSKGRVTLGVAMGYTPADFEVFGIPMSRRVSLFEEGIEIIRRAWTEEKFNFVGKRYNLHNVNIRPKPHQKPHPPIWIGAWTLPGYQRAARLGDAIVTDPCQSRAALKDFVAAYRALAVQRGKKPYVAMSRYTLIGRDKEDALRLFGESVTNSFRYYSFAPVLRREYEPWLQSVKTEEDVTWEKINFDDRFFYGSPEDIVEQIHRFNEELGGLDYVLPFFVGGAGPDGQKAQLEAIKTFGEKVIPRVRRR